MTTQIKSELRFYLIDFESYNAEVEIEQELNPNYGEELTDEDFISYAERQGNVFYINEIKQGLLNWNTYVESKVRGYIVDNNGSIKRISDTLTTELLTNNIVKD
jgi:hypothetical protein